MRKQLDTFRIDYCVSCRPTITTEKGDLKIRSPGNMVFMAGNGGTVEFMSSNGSGLVVGEKGEKVDMLYSIA